MEAEAADDTKYGKGDSAVAVSTLVIAADYHHIGSFSGHACTASRAPLGP